MKNFTLIAVLSLCSFSWISVSFCQSQTVEVQTGEEVTLLSNNMSDSKSVVLWFRLVDGTKTSCISLMTDSSKDVVYDKGFQHGKFKMNSNVSTVSLKIKQVNLSDAGLYFCGFYNSGRPVFSVTRLDVKGSHDPHDDVRSKCENESEESAQLNIVILAGLTVFLVMLIIGLVVKIMNLQTAGEEEEQSPEHQENVGSDDLNYAAVTFRLEPNVVYASTR
ncbi:uncharacterized protein LOC121626372 [Chelmon rostratus]|uniref:uncharacterized protein LOC121626372 n=1 Tax=Chelmon rostratus TaxID=109905 RepID=UPI001BE97C6E|nr:uncharacterized protein LOC121626372 [Chelmon rostratus]